MPRALEKLSSGRLFNNPAKIHHGDLAANGLGDREIVTYERIGEPEALLKLGQKTEHLGLHGNIERRHGFV